MDYSSLLIFDISPFINTMTRMNIILGYQWLQNRDGLVYMKELTMPWHFESTMTFGKTPASRITDSNAVSEIIDLFGSYGYKELGKSWMVQKDMHLLMGW